MKTKLLIAALVLGFTPSVTQAASIDFTGIGKAEVVTITGIQNVTAWAGELNWKWSSGKPSGWDDPFYSYCVDVLHYETSPQNVEIISTNDLNFGTSGATLASFAGHKAAWLFNTYAETIHGSSDPNAKAMAAGLQLAIWEALYDDDLLLTTGQFKATASLGAVGYANSYLTALTATGDGYQSARATVLDAAINPNVRPSFGQDQIINTPVPEPGTLALMGIGLGGLVMRRRRTRA